MCHLQELYAKYKNKGLVVLGLDPADDKKIGLGLLRENGVTFPNIIEDSKAANRVANQDYPLAAWPTSYIIGRDGKVVDVWIGYDEGEPRAMAALQKASPELGEAIRQEMKAKAARASRRLPPQLNVSFRPFAPPITTTTGSAPKTGNIFRQRTWTTPSTTTTRAGCAGCAGSSRPIPSPTFGWARSLQAQTARPRSTLNCD